MVRLKLKSVAQLADGEVDMSADLRGGIGTVQKRKGSFEVRERINDGFIATHGHLAWHDRPPTHTSV
jgi:hypothetical protein